MGTAVSKREYNYCLDFIKGIACICVVFMHCEFPGVLGTAIQCVSRFCVPFFFMVSGYYCYNGEENTTEEKVKRAIKKIKHLGGIIIAAVLIYTAFEIIREGGIEPISFAAIRNFILFNEPFIIADQMWFLFALFYDYILYAIVDRLNLHKFAYACIPALVVFYICLAQGAHLAGVAVPNIIYRNFLIEGFCFFMLGNWIHCNQNKIRISNSSLV